MAATDRLPDGLQLRRLSPADVDAAVALNAEAGWNQIDADWQYMLSAGRGMGIEDADGALVATSIVLPYQQRFAWIAMILVTASWQRKGLATMLMTRAIADCRAGGWIAGLDATEAGRQVYLPLGFKDIYPIDRLTAENVTASSDRIEQVRPLTEANIDQVVALDRQAFGADRAELLAHLRARQPDLAFIAQDGSGYILARNGRQATQLGPLIAADETTAQALVAAALARVDGTVFLDLVSRHTSLRAWLDERGFTRQRGYMRMLLDAGEALDDPERVFLLAGPELG
jgi:GNAT superfamily N-acetyltransferase